MAMRSKEFVGKAEGIKSHELSVKSLIENLKSTLSRLEHQKSSLERTISSLYVELAAARRERDYELIADIKNEISETKEELNDTKEEIVETSTELGKAEKEFEQVEEEKQQTLFEIQERARTTSQNISNANSMYGAYADVGASLSRSFQESFDALAKAATILDGSVGSSGGQSRTGGSTNTHSRKGVGICGVIGATAAIAGANHIVAGNQTTTYHSNQSSVSSHTPRQFHSNGKFGSTQTRGSSLHSAQLSVAKSNSTNALQTNANCQNNNLESMQKSHSGDSNIQNNTENIAPKETSSILRNLSSNQVSNVTTSSIAVAKKTFNGDNSKENMKKNSILTDGTGFRVGRNSFIENLIVQDWELGKYSNSSMSSLRRNIAKSDYEIYLKNESDYQYISYEKPSVVYVDPATIVGIRGVNDSNFWSYKTTSYADYIDMARQIPLVYAMAKSGQKLVDLEKCNGVIGACAKNYFLKDDITAVRVGNSYIFGDEGRHRVMAALMAGVNIPIRLTGEMVKNNNSVEVEKKSIQNVVKKENSSEYRKNFAKLSFTVSQKIAQADKCELMNIVKNEQIAQRVDFGEMDIKVAREFVDTIWKVKSQYPFLELPYIGSTQVLNNNLRENIKVNLTRLYVQNNPSASMDEILEAVEIQTNAYMKKFKIKENDLAVSISVKKPQKIERPEPGFEVTRHVTQYIGDTFSSKLSGISINTDNAKSYDDLCENLKFGEKCGASPKGCNTVSYLVYHEIAHQLDSILHFFEDSEIIHEYNKHIKLSVDEQKNNLCTYASKNIHEFIAEAWAESQCSTSPRRVAKLIGEKVSKATNTYMNAKKGVDDYVRERER